jgi:hypothetical protein
LWQTNHFFSFSVVVHFFLPFFSFFNFLLPFRRKSLLSHPMIRFSFLLLMCGILKRLSLYSNRCWLHLSLLSNHFHHNHLLHHYHHVTLCMWSSKKHHHHDVLLLLLLLLPLPPFSRYAALFLL